MARLLDDNRITLLWLAVLCAYVLAGTPLAPFHGDEATLIYMGRDFHYQAVQGDLSLVTYSDDPDSVIESGATQQQLRLLNGTVSKYLYGLAAYLGGYRLETINDQWVWGWDYETNRREGHMPADDLLLRARWMSAALVAGAVVVMFALAKVAGGVLAAYLASLYLALNPALLLNGRRAMMEGALLFFSLLAVWLALIAYQRRGWGWYALWGVVCGLTVASKHTGVVIVAASFAALLMLALRDRQPSVVGRLLLAGVVSLGVFYGLNPAWWGDPVGRAAQVLAMRSQFIQDQVSFFGGYGDFGAQMAGFVDNALIAAPDYSETPDFIPYIADQIAAYEQSGLAGVMVGAGLVGALVGGLLALIGLVALWRRPQTDQAARFVVTIWALAVLALTLLVTPLDWQRYYLPVMPALGLLAAVGLAWLLDQASAAR